MKVFIPQVGESYYDSGDETSHEIRRVLMVEKCDEDRYIFCIENEKGETWWISPATNQSSEDIPYRWFIE